MRSPQRHTSAARICEAPGAAPVRSTSGGSPAPLLVGARARSVRRRPRSQNSEGPSAGGNQTKSRNAGAFTSVKFMSVVVPHIYVHIHKHVYTFTCTFPASELHVPAAREPARTGPSPFARKAASQHGHTRFGSSRCCVPWGWERHAMRNPHMPDSRALFPSPAFLPKFPARPFWAKLSIRANSEQLSLRTSDT